MMAMIFSKHILEHGIFTTSEDQIATEKRIGPRETGFVTRNRICSRNNYFFVAVGNTVRCCEINSSTISQYKVRLNTPRLCL